MDQYSQQQFEAFFTSIASWRAAYIQARLHYLAVRTTRGLSIVTARIYLDIGGMHTAKPPFRAGKFEAGEWEIDQKKQSVEAVVAAILSDDGLYIEGVGEVRFSGDEEADVFGGPPILLHPEGLNSGNRLAVFTWSGINWQKLVPQPESDWLLKAADNPYDSVQELCVEYGLGILRGDRATLEVVARTAVQVLATSRVEGTSANLGVWMGQSLERAKARLGYRILNNGRVIRRDTVSGEALVWQENDFAQVGSVQMTVPAGSIVQCIASYDGHAHNVQWRADPTVHTNPRAAVLGLVDPRKEVLQNFLQPESPLRGKAADDFEAGVAWLLWALGFSTATFGTNSKTTDAFDTVAVSPNGNFLVVECTLGLLKAESKLSKLGARAARLREALDASNMKHLRVLPVMVSALSLDQVLVDIPSAEENGILVFTRENLISALTIEMLRFPDADSLFARGVAQIEERREARKKKI